MTRLLNIFTVMLTAMALMMPIAHAQKTPFTGTIVFDVSAQGNIPDLAKAMMPTVMTYQFSTDKQSMALNFQMAQQKTIFDPATNMAKVLMNLLGQKFVINQTTAELDNLRKQEGETIGINATNETKTIAGYLCKKAVITRKTRDGKENVANIYYTEAIDVSKFKAFSPFPEIKGFPLEFSMKSGSLDFKVVAKTITKETIPASEFEVGSDYKPMSAADLQKFLGGMGSLMGK
jgi:hypothetical protein